MKNLNLPKTRVFIRCDAWGGSASEWEPAWLLSVRLLRNRPLCFQAWVDSVAGCYDKIPPHCLYWYEPDESEHVDYPLHKIQMWECLSGHGEMWRKDQLADVPCVVNMGKGEIARGHYWLTIDFIPDGEGVGLIDVGDNSCLEEHKEANGVRLDNGQIAWYPNNRLKYLPVSLTPHGAAERIPDWEVASDQKWDEWWLDSDEILGSETKFFYGTGEND